jgi:hypothetical protein
LLFQLDLSPDETTLWKQSEILVIGTHYSKKFFEEQIGIFRHRCEEKKETFILLLDPQSPAARYFKEIDPEIPNLTESVKIIENLLTSPQHLGENHSYLKIFLHHYVLRYAFVATEEYIWVSLFANSKGITPIPALKVQAGTPLYGFFWNDFERLKKQAKCWDKKV